MNYPQNLAEILSLYALDVQAKNPSKKAMEILNQTKTAIDRFTLPGWGFPAFAGRKPTQAEIRAAIVFKQGITVEQFVSAQDAQKIGFDLLQASANSRYVYASALSKLLDWCSQFPWWPANHNSNSVKSDRCLERRRKGFGSLKETRLTNRAVKAPYGLRTEQVSPSLMAELDLYSKYRTSNNWPSRLEKPIKPKACAHQVKLILHILGWFHHYKGIPLLQLSLALLIPKVELKYADNKEQAKLAAARAGEYVDDWVCEFCNFLETERSAQSPHTRKNYFCVLLAVAKLQYHRETTDSKFRDIPAIEVLRQRLSLANKDLKNHAPVADQEKKWMELPEVLSRIVEPLRSECQPRTADGSPRSLTAVLSSIQCYVLWGCFTYSPPRRQQELRELKIALSCPIKRPLDVDSNGLIHPLPTGKERERTCGYLYKTADGRWVKDMPPESYKTGESYGHQELEIPNVKFPDGSCFYDYLEMWLYGYFKAPDGSLVSCGSCFYPQAYQPSRWYQGRMLYEPNHDYVFTQKNGKPFAQDSMAKYISSAAHALTGQRVTPHILRDIYATYFLDQGYSDATISSLAYAMGHSPDILREIYDRRRPVQKHRPIQQAVLQLVHQSLGGEQTEILMQG